MNEMLIELIKTSVLEIAVAVVVVAAEMKEVELESKLPTYFQSLNHFYQS